MVQGVHSPDCDFGDFVKPSAKVTRCAVRAYARAPPCEIAFEGQIGGSLQAPNEQACTDKSGTPKDRYPGVRRGR